MGWAIPAMVLGTALLLGAYRSVLLGGGGGLPEGASGTGLASLAFDIADRVGMPTLWLELLTGVRRDRSGAGADVSTQQQQQQKRLEDDAFNDHSTEVNLPQCQRTEFRVEQLRMHDHLCMLGHVFDVSVNPAMYGTKGGYSSFTGSEGTHNFVMGNPVNASERYALDGLSLAQLDELIKWLKFYTVKYTCIGYLGGPYYTAETGKPTPYLQGLLRVWRRMRVERAALANEFPRCQSTSEDGKHIMSCEPLVKPDGSGSIERWPRQLLEPGAKSMRCACVRPDQLGNERLRPLFKCPETETRCNYLPENFDTNWSHLELLVNTD